MAEEIETLPWTIEFRGKKEVKDAKEFEDIAGPRGKKPLLLQLMRKFLQGYKK